jgi:hypothetical protein
LEFDVPPPGRDFVVGFDLVAIPGVGKYDMADFPSFLSPCHFSLIKQFQMLQENCLCLWSFYNRFACLVGVSCSSKQKTK